MASKFINGVAIAPHSSRESNSFKFVDIDRWVLTSLYTFPTQVNIILIERIGAVASEFPNMSRVPNVSVYVPFFTGKRRIQFLKKEPLRRYDYLC